MNLYEINKALADKMTKLGELLNDGGEPTQEQIDECIDLQGELSEKLVSYGFVIKNLSGELDSVDSEIKRLTAIKKARQNHIDILKSRMQMAMTDNNIKKIDHPVMPIIIKNNSPSVRLDIDPDHLPTQFVQIKYEADKAALSKALKTGDVIDGVSLEVKQSIKIG